MTSHPVDPPPPTAAAVVDALIAEYAHRMASPHDGWRTRNRDGWAAALTHAAMVAHGWDETRAEQHICERVEDISAHIN